MVRGGGFAGGPVVVNNTLQWKLFRERVYNIFIYTQLFRVKNFSSICLYCIISSKPWGGEGVGGGGMWVIKTDEYDENKQICLPPHKE